MFPLILLLKPSSWEFLYQKELIILIVAVFFLDLLAQQSINTFFAFIITIVCCAAFFNYVIATNIKRFTISLNIFFGLLMLSSIIMLLDHQYDMIALRSFMAGGDVLQKPSGIATTIFTYGYQLSALAPFLFVGAMIYKKHTSIRVIGACLCLVFIFYGMQRSVLIGFLVSITLFILFYYRAKSFLILIFVAGILFFSQSEQNQFLGHDQQNIFNKNQSSKENENRSDLLKENVKIIENFPLGILFYGKTWEDVAQHNPVYKNGIGLMTSHNAYLMFVTYLGPLLGVIFLLLIYKRVLIIVFEAIMNSRKRKDALLICLCCSFICITLNACFHNEWLLDNSGPTLFLYFSILQLSHIRSLKPIPDEHQDYQTVIVPNYSN